MSSYSEQWRLGHESPAPSSSIHATVLAIYQIVESLGLEASETPLVRAWNARLCINGSSIFLP